MTASARFATTDDVPVLAELYRKLEAEMADLSDLWADTDGLSDPIVEMLAGLIGADGAVVVIGTFDGYPFGFLIARIEPTLVEGLDLGVIRFVFVEEPARGVAIGEEMRDLAMDELRSRGIRRFDAHVLPGHRLAKNFFEQGGFSARHIVMHHDDDGS